ncbi:hypothetical protein AGMMS49965_00580 [Bacteroidia bacterium]|nr:hypothetical protein AGMMS49965_00580 [Bacteroidia bacterium]
MCTFAATFSYIDMNLVPVEPDEGIKMQGKPRKVNHIKMIVIDGSRDENPDYYCSSDFDVLSSSDNEALVNVRKDDKAA